jgi:hypothetical protein
MIGFGKLMSPNDLPLARPLISTKQRTLPICFGYLVSHAVIK